MSWVYYFYGNDISSGVADFRILCNAFGEKLVWNFYGDYRLIIGIKQKLRISRIVDFGVYLQSGQEEVLLPKKYLLDEYFGDEDE